MPPTPPPPLPAPRTCGRKSQSRVLAERCSFAEKGLTHNFHVLKGILSLLNCQMGILRIGRNMFCQFPPALVLLPGEQGARGYYGVPVGGDRVTGPVQRPHQRGGGGGGSWPHFHCCLCRFGNCLGIIQSFQQMFTNRLQGLGAGDAGVGPCLAASTVLQGLGTAQVHRPGHHDVRLTCDPGYCSGRGGRGAPSRWDRH